MRILICLHQYFPDFGTGTEVLVLRVVRGLVASRQCVGIFTGHPTNQPVPAGRELNEIVYEDVPVFQYLTHEGPSAPLRHDTIARQIDNDASAAAFERVVLEFKPDVVHFFHLARITTAPIAVCLRRKIPYFVTLTDFWFSCSTGLLELEDGHACPGPSTYAENCLRHLTWIRFPRLRRFSPFIDVAAQVTTSLAKCDTFKRWPVIRVASDLSLRARTIATRINGAKVIWTASCDANDLCAEWGLDVRRLRVLRYPVEKPTADDCVRHRRANTPLRLGYIGTVSPHKGLHVLCSAIQADPRLTVELRVFGDLTRYPEYSQAVLDEARGDGRIAFDGTFPPDAIHRVIDSFDALVIPSLWRENSPMVAIEALARNCPVVASSQPGLSAVVRDGVDGILFPPGDHAALTEVLSRLCADPALLVRLSSNASWKISAEVYVDTVMKAYLNR